MNIYLPISATGEVVSYVVSDYEVLNKFSITLKEDWFNVNDLIHMSSDATNGSGYHGIVLSLVPWYRRFWNKYFRWTGITMAYKYRIQILTHKEYEKIVEMDLRESNKT